MKHVGDRLPQLFGPSIIRCHQRFRSGRGYRSKRPLTGRHFDQLDERVYHFIRTGGFRRVVGPVENCSNAVREISRAILAGATFVVRLAKLLQNRCSMYAGLYYDRIDTERAELEPVGISHRFQGEFTSAVKAEIIDNKAASDGTYM